MKNKTQVLINSETHQCSLHKGMKGYIDGYCRGGDDRPYAVVVVGSLVDFVPTYALTVLPTDGGED